MTADFLARYERAINQRIYVVGHDIERLALHVQGTQKTTYIVSLSPTFECTCFDYVINGHKHGMCKHMINVLVKAFKLPLEKVLEIDDDLLVSSFCKLLDTFRAEEAKQAENAKNDVDCVICFEQIQAEEQTWTCTVCGHRLHSSCWRRWSQRSATCPFCRS